MPMSAIIAACVDMAEWALNNLWHNASEEPKQGKAIILYGEDMCIPTKAICAEYDKENIIIQDTDKWCYLDDILLDNK